MNVLLLFLFLFISIDTGLCHDSGLNPDRQINKPDKTLKIALIHLNVIYKDLETNTRHLLDLNKKAAESGVDLILNTEMAASGYSFTSREDIADYTVSEHGKLLSGLAGIAKENGVYIVAGAAEKDSGNGIYYNSSFAFDPDGKLICKYRKINAESKWACPGQADQNGIFDTPWGRLGMLICSDSYYGLMPRSMALQGVNLLLIPANWPPGEIDPVEIWRARVMENGFFIAVCNRTGMDRIMDCNKGLSCLINPDGEAIFSGSSEDSQIFFTNIPLDKYGKICGKKQKKIMAERDTCYFKNIYLDLRLTPDLTEHYELPEPGILSVECLVSPEKSGLNAKFIENKLQEFYKNKTPFIILPRTSSSVLSRKELLLLSKRFNAGFSIALVGKADKTEYLLITPDGLESYIAGTANINREIPFPISDFGSARIAMVPYQFFKHPEIAVALAKSGCDLVVLSEENLDSENHLLTGIKTIENVAIAICANNRASIFMPPVGCHRWVEKDMDAFGICSFQIDTSKTRTKRFQDRINFELLLQPELSDFLLDPR